MKEELTATTKNYIKSTPLDHRKKMGQYFTPRSLRETLLEKLPKIENPKILDPACGTGEFLLSSFELFNNPEVHGWELDPKLASLSEKKFPLAKIKKTNSLFESTEEQFDFVIGNPPYFELKPTLEIQNIYGDILKGRTNIYSLFIYKGIQLLKEGGYLAYIVPPSMNNGAYFTNLRDFIISQCDIEHLSVQYASDIFDGASQSVMLLILKKGPNTGKYLFTKNNITIFSEKVKFLNESFRKATTLDELGYKVSTGSLVWNEHKEKLSTSEQNSTLLIWSKNITPNGLRLNNHNKPQYVKLMKYDIGPAIVVNRIVGQPGRGSLRAAIIPEGEKFIAENHVNVISRSPKKLLDSHGGQVLSFTKLLEQLNSSKQLEILQAITGNSQISKTELEKLFPIDLPESTTP